MIGNDGSEGIIEVSDYLNDNIDDIDEVVENYSLFVINLVGGVISNESVEEGIVGENRDDEWSLGFGNSFGIGEFDGVDEDLGVEDIVDVIGVVVEENIIKGSEGVEEVGFLGDGSFNMFDVLGSS